MVGYLDDYTCPDKIDYMDGAVCIWTSDGDEMVVEVRGSHTSSPIQVTKRSSYPADIAKRIPTLMTHLIPISEFPTLSYFLRSQDTEVATLGVGYLLEKLKDEYKNKHEK